MLEQVQWVIRGGKMLRSHKGIRSARDETTVDHRQGRNNISLWAMTQVESSDDF
jgi:hypothetical protein